LTLEGSGFGLQANTAAQPVLLDRGARQVEGGKADDLAGGVCCPALEPVGDFSAGNQAYGRR
jgi:hypothetical protein